MAGGAGLTTNSFSVTVNGGSSAPPPPPPSSGCSAAYSVVNSWSGGYQAQVVVTNTGSGTLNGWQLEWAFPGSEDITNLWNGTCTQSGAQVTVSNASYDGSLAPGATATVGFTANGSGTPAPGASCSWGNRGENKAPRGWLCSPSGRSRFLPPVGHGEEALP